MKVPASFRWFVLLLFFTVWLSFPHVARADEPIFWDEFNNQNIDSDHWELFPYQNGSIVTSNAESVSLYAPSGTKFPYMFMKNVLIPDNMYSISTRFKFSGAVSYGNGLVFSDSILPSITNSGLSSNDFIFAIWTTSSTTASLVTTLCPTTLLNCSNGTPVALYTFDSTNWTDINIKELAGHYEIVIGNRGFETKDAPRKISKFWIGNPQSTSTSQNWATINVDYLHISRTTLKPPRSVILLPGFGGSWDLDAILAGTEGNNWAIPSFIKNYEGIIQSFKNADYTEGENLFVFPYDWRKPLSELADDLKIFIESKNLTGKVDLVGHSMGGIVARAYAQKYGTERIDKILTAGSPHLGVIDMYGLWEGAKIWDGVWWQKVLLEIATEVNRLPGESKVSAVRRVSPSIIDLFPTFPFLISGGSTLGIDTMIQKNLYLNTLNQNVAILGDKLTPFWSDDINSTRNSINVSTRSEEDITQNRWEDGKPLGGEPFGKTSGDGTVTKISATGPFGVGEKLTGWHSDLLSSQDNIAKVFQKLGLDPTKAVSSPTTDSRENAFVGILRSPGTLEVCDEELIKCNDQLGLYFPGYKLFILPGYDQEDLVVRVKETGEIGAYKLHIGNIDDSPDWIVQDGELKTAGQIDFYGVKNSGENISVIHDQTAPSVNITAPLARSYRKDTLPTLSYLVTDNWDTSPSVTTVGWSDTEGEHTFRVTATDRAGNVGVGSVTYRVDNTPPLVKILSPLAKSYESDDLPRLTYSILDNQDPKPLVVETGWSRSEGSHTVKVTATDKAGNVGVGSVTYTVQNPPTSKDQCKKDRWRIFRWLGFKNQGNCEKYVEKHKPWSWYKFFDHWSRFDR